jgi:hypothetical protein
MEHRTTRPDDPSSRAQRPGDEPGGPPRGDDPLADSAEGFFDPYADAGDERYRDRPEDPFGAPPPPRGARPSMSAFFVLLDALRRGLPPELREQFTALVREALLTLRSLIDWYLDRLDHPRRDAKVEDIPID